MRTLLGTWANKKPPQENPEAVIVYGGERGIRTLDTPFRIYTISNRALSSTQPSLLNTKAYSAAGVAGAGAAASAGRLLRGALPAGREAGRRFC